MSAALRVCLLLFALSCAFVYAQDISIVYPAGGETFNVGTTITIQWTGGAPQWPMLVQIIDVVAWQVYVTVRNDAPNTGSLDWVVDAPSGLYQAYVQGDRDQNDSTWAYGNSFTIVAPPTPIPPTPIPPTSIPPTPIPPTPIPPTPNPPTPVPHPGGCAWIQNPTAATCPGWCTWNCALNLCYDSYCPSLESAQACSAVSGCAWYNGKCRDYNLQYGSFPNCALSTSALTCGGTSCTWSTKQNACIPAASACAWLTQHSWSNCADKCWYSAAIGYCYDPTCTSLLTSADCSGQGGCAWYNGYCYDYNLQYSGFSCSLAEEVAECPASRCHWDGTACHAGAGAPTILPPAPHNGGCAWVQNPTAATCPAGCTFDANLNICYDATCPLHHTPASCSSVSGCSWYRDQCRDYQLQYGILNCSESFSSTTCGGNYCDWSYKQNKCLSVSANSACAWLPQGNPLSCPDRCSYSDAVGFCYNAQCSSAATSCACSVLSSAGCAWSNGKCLDYNLQYGSYSCSQATSKALCGKNCVWNAATSTCS